MKINRTEVEIIKGDITALKVDAIINAANNRLVMGGGVAGAIKRKGGRKIEEEAVKQGPIGIGEAVYTSAGSLPCRYVIHAATMGMDFSTDEVKIRLAVKNALQIAEKLKIGSAAFPALGCGTGNFPYLASAKITAQELLSHLRRCKHTRLKKITICLYDDEACAVFKKGVIGYLDYVIRKLQTGPFTTVDAIIEVKQAIVLIKRSNPPFGWALPGGFVDYGESLEDAVTREAKEETGLTLAGLKQFHTYSAPERDPRFHTIATVFIAQAKGRPKAGDDAADLKLAKPQEAVNLPLAFDHAKIIADYLEYKKAGCEQR